MRAVALTVSMMGSYEVVLAEECHELIQGVKVTVLCNVENTVRSSAVAVKVVKSGQSLNII